MAAERDCPEDPAVSGGQDRRTFLRTLAGLGALASAGIASAAPSLSRTPQVSAQASTLTRSSAALKLQQPLALQRLTRGRSGPKVQLPPPPGVLGEPPQPSTRQRALQAAFGPGSALRAADFGLAAGAGGAWGLSAPLTQVMSTDPLAGAYAAGITLTPEGCQYAPGAEYQTLSGKDPMTYDTLQATVEPATFGKKLRLITAEMNSVFNFFFAVLLNTPGAWEDRLTYVVEVSMEPFEAGFEAFITSDGPPGKPWESNAVNFSPTNDGTRMALIELPGSAGADGYAHTLFFRRGTGNALFTNFNWLNVIAL